MALRWQGTVRFKFLLLYLVHAFLATCVSIAFIGLLSSRERDGVDAALWSALPVTFWLGQLLFLLGMVGVLIAVWQLKRFKAYARLQGKRHAVCMVGLWNYSRHPNFFFEWVIWLGFAMMSYASPYGIVALFSPLVLGAIMLAVNIPSTEQQLLKTRGELYRAYQRTTNVFIPFPYKWF